MRLAALAAALSAAVVALAACRSGPPRARGAAAAPWEAANPLRPLPAPQPGSGADFARVPWVTPEKVRLGRWLFHDARLSADGTVSCATCHRSAHGFSEPTAVSTGIRGQQGTRKAPPILNLAFAPSAELFWDGRATGLVEQAKGPLVNPIEMGGTSESVVAAVASVPGYRRYFREAFGTAEVTLDRIAEAIAAYEATLLSGNSRADRFEAGDATALDEEERAGRELFVGRGRCKECHPWPAFTDGKFHNVGIGWDAPDDALPRMRDAGRYAHTGEPRDTGAFKTPTLRDCSRRAPYMHDGSVESLEDVVLHYWRGGTENPWLSEKIEPLRMPPRVALRLAAYLRAMDGEGYEDRGPAVFPQ